MNKVSKLCARWYTKLEEHMASITKYVATIIRIKKSKIKIHMSKEVKISRPEIYECRYKSFASEKNANTNIRLDNNKSMSIESVE